MVEAIPKPIKDTWDKWNVRGSVIPSLSLQIVLVLFAPLRRRTSRKALFVLVWSSYLLADWSANFAVGLISKNQGKDPKPDDPPHDKKLMALWAPFLLLHLGGPDAVTALAIQDNELWLRHFFGLVFQAVAGAYSFVQSLPNPLCMPIVLLYTTGIIRYVERIMALNSASFENLRRMMYIPGPDYAKLMEQYMAMKDSKLPVKLVVTAAKRDKHQNALQRSPESLTDFEMLHWAFKFYNIFKALVVDLMVSLDDRGMSSEFFRKLSPQKALRIIELELGFIYDAMCTKTKVLYTPIGAIFRLVGFVSLVCAFHDFHSRSKKGHEFHEADIVLTYVLFIAGIALDIISLFISFFSYWLIARVCSTNHSLLNWILGFSRPRWKKYNYYKENNQIELEVLTTPFLFRRWAGSIHIFNFIAYCLETRAVRIQKVKERNRHFLEAAIRGINISCRSIKICLDGFHKFIVRFITYLSKKNLLIRYILCPLKISAEFWFRIPQLFGLLGSCIVNYLGINDSLEEVRFVSSEPLTKDLWKFIFDELKHKSHTADSPEIAKRACSVRGEFALRDSMLEMAELERLMRFVVNVNYEHSLLLWHIATELCYQTDVTSEDRSAREFSRTVADYMMYLLIMKPTLVPHAGTGKRRFRDTWAEAGKFFRWRGIESSKDLTLASKAILSVSTEIDPRNVKGDRSMSVLFDASALAKELQRLEKKWQILSKVWVELLSYAAWHCNATAHVEQLSRGGELISFVWLLMAHFGLGDKFHSMKIGKAKLIVGN